MDIELMHSRISVILHVVTGTIAGYLSFFLVSTLYGVGAAIAILLASGYLAEKLVKKKGLKWWIGNGAIIYLIVWLVSWIFFFNVF